ncbi:aspartyl protease family protein [Marchantia polymorpha subsp. ruderalis]|uniref:Peptidase A1 domain-containing protein n=2 Tax=Marchantia polymorpha TaxID=3197 RepID=A0AAF6B4M7_MARPO|nr:hypothetical protein MARPO_0100s0045 [Marchantia polymorpha]BBN06961.1 hypothetical protein Mp_3g25320 [Marchantia polymorpha subsp. ruderalis]|eukprot:PTQ32339.1 hypothetical protein MARPO_0100s0045 [Marchantia polymorpha]
MGSRGFRMQLFAVAVILQLAIQSVPSASLGLDDSAYWAAVESKRALGPQATSEATGDYFKADLTHFQHSMSNLSLSERVRMAVKRSKERLNYFQSQISKRSVLRPEATYATSVYSNQGSYLMSIEIGTPARSYVAIADTGSDLVWIQGTPCTQCFQQPDPFFNSADSSTYKQTGCSDELCAALPRRTCSTSTCEYAYAYGDQSTTQGEFGLDTVTLRTSSNAAQTFPNFGFGVGHKNQGTFLDTDGLVGLGQGPLSLVSQLGSQFGNIFSYCLVDFYSSSSVTSKLLFGSAGGSPKYTPMVTNVANPTFYYVNVVGINVGGSPLNYPSSAFAIDGSGNGGFILDSGTTVTQLPMEAYTPLVQRLTSLISYPVVDGSRIGFDLCYDLSAVAQPTVPSIVFKFQDVDVDLPGNNMFLQIDNAGTFCLAMQGSSYSLGIFGNVQQQNFEVVHDRANRKIGFEPKKC